MTWNTLISPLKHRLFGKEILNLKNQIENTQIDLKDLYYGNWKKILLAEAL